MGTSQTVSRTSFGVLFLLAVTFVAATPQAWMPSAAGQGAISRINAQFEQVQTRVRSDLVLVPLLGDMEPPPAGVDQRRTAALATPQLGVWAAAKQWAAAEPQQAVLNALSEVTQVQDVRRAFAFAQPYGQEALVSQPGGIELLGRNLYSEIPGDPPLLAATKFHLLPLMDQVVCLLHIEATRLAAEGDPDAAANVLADGILFARQMADRAFSEEVRWGYDAIAELQERIRDIYYQDFRSRTPVAKSENVISLVRRLDEQTGYLEMGRARFPGGDLEAAAQLVSTVMEERGGPREGVFGSVLASLGSVDRPLRLFSETARWRDTASQHANWFDTTDTLRKIGDDYRFRWSRSWWDAVHRPPTTYATLQSNPDKYAAIFAALPELEGLYLSRLRSVTESRGTRHALGVMAFARDTGNLPTSLAATRPRYVPRLDDDPLNRTRFTGGEPPLEYFVPIRDTARGRDARDQGQPHEVVIINPDGTDVAFRLREDQFVLYSVGSDGQKNWAEEVQNTMDAPSGRDYLFWPPVLSLLRQDLIDTGRLR